MNDRNARLLIVAMEMLRRAVTDSAASHLAAMKAGANPQAHGTQQQAATAAAGGGGGTEVVDTPNGPKADPIKVVIVRDETARQNPGGRAARPEPARPGSSSSGGGLAGAIVAGFGRILAPLMLVTTVVGGLLSGLSIVTSALKVFAATLAPILLPVFVLFSAAIIAASDVIWAKLKPALDDWYAFILSQGVPVVEAFIDGLKDAAEAVVDFAHWVERQINSLDPEAAFDEVFGDGDTDTAARQRAEKDALDERLGRNNTGRGDYDKGVSSGGDFGAGGDYGAGDGGNIMGRAATAAAVAQPKSTKDLVNSALKDTIKELRLQQGPQASFTGVSQAVKNVQLAAINASPFEQKMLERMGTALDKLEKLVGNTEAKPTRRHE